MPRHGARTTQHFIFLLVALTTVYGLLLFYRRRSTSNGNAMIFEQKMRHDWNTTRDKNRDSKNRHQNVAAQNGTQTKVQTSAGAASTGFITVNSIPNGRLGNHMFMYAALLGIAQKTSKTAYLHSKLRVSYMFPYLTVQQNQQIQPMDRKQVNSGPAGKFNPRMMVLPQGNFVLNGFFQSWRYFHEIRDRLKNEFRFSESTRTKCTNTLANAQKEGCVNVGVHMRRGDMTMKNEYEPASAEYFDRAVKWFKNKLSSAKCIHFLVVGDDIEWNRKNAPKPLENTKIQILDKAPIDHDLCVLARSDHVIMSVGSYGWWGAYLNDGLVTYQKNFAKPESGIRRMYNDEEFFLPEWTGL